MCIGIRASGGVQRPERPLDGDQVADHLDGLDGRLVGIGPASDLVEVVAETRQLAGALTLDLGVRHGPRARPAQPTAARDPTASSLPSAPWRATRHAPPRWRGSSPRRRVRRSLRAVAVVGVRGGTAPRQPLPGTHGVWPQRVGWLPGLSGVRQARRRRVREPSSAAANAVAEHPRERSGEPVQRASRSAVGGGMEARDAGPSMYPRSRSGD